MNAIRRHLLDSAWESPDRLRLMADDPAAPPIGGQGGGSGGEGGDGTPPPNDGTGDPPAGEGTPLAADATPPARTDWRDRQIDRQHRKIKESETALAERDRRLAEVEAENQRLRELAEAASRGNAPPAATPPAAPSTPPARPAAAPPAATPEADRTKVKDEVRLEVQIENIQEEIKANEGYAKAWPTVFSNFQKLGGLDPAVMGQVLATDDPAYVLMEIGKNPDRYQELLDLPANKRQAEFIKVALAKPKPAAPPPKPSDAPPPVDALNRGGGAPPPPTGDIYNPDLRDDQFYAIRMEQKRNSRGRPWSIGGKAGAA